MLMHWDYFAQTITRRWECMNDILVKVMCTIVICCNIMFYNLCWNDICKEKLNFQSLCGLSDMYFDVWNRLRQWIVFRFKRHVLVKLRCACEINFKFAICLLCLWKLSHKSEMYWRNLDSLDLLSNLSNVLFSFFLSGSERHLVFDLSYLDHLQCPSHVTFSC